MIRVRHKLILLVALVVLAVSSGFTWLSLALAQRAIQEDLRTRAIVYAREVAATLGDGRQLQGGDALGRLIARLLEIRRSVLQLDVLALGSDDATEVVASSHPGSRIPFTKKEAEEIRAGQVVARAVAAGGDRYWEIMAPVALDGSIVGAVAAKISTQRADELTSRIRFWAVTLAAASVVLIGVLMSVTIQLVVDRPIGRFMGAISSVGDAGVPARVDVKTSDEFGVLAGQFNEMVARIGRFNEEMRLRIDEATGELDRRNALVFEMQRRLGHAERLALAGRVMAEVAHEVGTPLHSVAGHLELLRKELSTRGSLSDESARRLGIIESQLRRVTEIITRLLDVTRRAPGEPGPVDLERLARDTVELVRPGLARAGVTLGFRAEPGAARVLGRPDQLQQVILNLLTNAIDATAGGGQIEVTTRAPDAGEVEIAVRDTGQGIAPAVRSQIFEPFFSTKEAGRGTGIGLFITAEIVREHKGRIEVDSTEGTGSTFRVTLPAVNGA